MKTAREESKSSASSRRAGYVVAVVVNAAMVFVVLNLLDWGVPPFLTEEFTLVVPLIVLSLVASMAANGAYLFFDPPWFRSLCQVGISVISLVVAIRMFQVFPFDFTGYDDQWSGVTRIVLVVAMAGSAIAVIAESVKLLSRLTRR